MGELDVLAYKRDIAPNFLCVYGGEKAGKTTTLVTLLDEEAIKAGHRMNIIDVDHGLEGFINQWGLKGKPIKRQNGKLTIPAVNIEVVSSLQEFHEAVWTLPEGYKYHIIDTLTRAGKYFIKSRQSSQTPGERDKKATMAIAFTFEDYIDRLEELAWDLNEEDPDAWLIIVCHQKVYDDFTEPLLYGSAGTKLSRVTTGIWRLQLQTKQISELSQEERDHLTEHQRDSGWVTGRQFRTAQTEFIVAGDRTEALDDIEPANFAQCLRKIREARAQGIKETK